MRTIEPDSTEPGSSGSGPNGADTWWARRTLRQRLTGGVVLLLLVAFSAVGVITAVALRSFLTDQLDDQLSIAGGRYSSGLEHSDVGPGGSDGDRDNRGQSVGTLGVRLVDGEVTLAAVVSADGTTSLLNLGDSDRAALREAAARSGPQSVDLDTLGSYRVQVAAGRDGDIQLTGLPLQAVEETVERLVLIELSVFGAVLLVGALVAALSVRLTLRPLNRVAESALTVAAMPLSTGSPKVGIHLPHVAANTEIGQVTAAFEKMVNNVETSLSARSRTEDQLRQFVADASHELRTPVSVIRSHTELALSDPADTPPTVALSLTRIDAHSRRMVVLVEGLLLLARLESESPTPTGPVDLSRLAVESVADAVVSGPDHHWRLDLPEDPVAALGDEQQLHQVIANLLTNARLHTPPGTTVTVAASRVGPTAVLEVTDDGPGIPDDLQGNIFDRFTRGDTARTTTAGGTGLGLAIVNALVQNNNGTVRLFSGPGLTTFRVELPPAPE